MLCLRNGKPRLWPYKRMSIDSFDNSLTSYELKIKSKVHNKEEVRVKIGIALKASQEEEDLHLFDGENVKLDESDVALMIKTIKKLFNNKRELRRGGPSSNQFY